MIFKQVAVFSKPYKTFEIQGKLGVVLSPFSLALSLTASVSLLRATVISFSMSALIPTADKNMKTIIRYTGCKYCKHTETVHTSISVTA